MDQCMLGEVLCPYCGHPMRPGLQRYNGTKVFRSAYCERCGSYGPAAEYDGMEQFTSKARKIIDELGCMAMQRALERPLRKPLTREELTNSAYQIPCWIEGIGKKEMAADVLDRDSAGLFARLASSTEGFTIYCDMDKYGIFWRAWAQMPTDEERKAAELEV